MCDMNETALESQNDPVKAGMGTSELDVMKDYVDEDSESPSSPDRDPFNINTSESDESDGKPRRKKFSLASHITINNDSSSLCYCCTVCNSYFSHRHSARNHEFCGSGKKPFKCKLCEKRFVKKSDREHHYRTHTGERPFTCDVCGKSFYLRHKLLRHIRSHSGVKGDFKCPECSRSFISREALRKHQVNKHNPNISIQCKNCGKSFEKIEERQKHKCIRPQKKKRLVCEVCGKTFSKNWNLTVHLRIHVGQRPFSCSVCNKSFRLRQHLDRHSTKHQADADFECMLCKQTFGRKDNMVRHLKMNHPDRHLGIDFKDMVQRSEKAKIAKSKRPSKESTVNNAEASAEKILYVLPVGNLPNIRFAKMPSENSKAPSAPVELPEKNINPLDPSVLKNSRIPGPSTQKTYETRLEKSVIFQTVIKSGTSSVLRTSVETRRFVQSTVVERVDPFKTTNLKKQSTQHSEPQPSVLVFCKSGENQLADACAQKSLASAPGGPFYNPDCHINLSHREESEEKVTERGQQGSVLRFSSRDPESTDQR